jgi:MFS family permease
MGLVAMATPLGSAVLSVVYQFFVMHYGWRSAFFALGISLWVLVVVPGLIFLRRQPEDLGMLPDGLAHAPTEETIFVESRSDLEFSWDRGDAARTAALRLLVTGAFLAAIGTGGVAFHMAAYMTDGAIPGALAATVVSVMALSGAFGNGLWGALAERFHPRRLNVLTMLVAAGSVALLMHVRSAATAYLFALLFGLNARGASVLTQILIARYFGRRSFGAISSILDPFHKGGLGLGALFAGIAFDYFGDYGAVFSLFIVSYLVSALLIFLTRKPAQKMK